MSSSCLALALCLAASSAAFSSASFFSCSNLSFSFCFLA